MRTSSNSLRVATTLAISCVVAACAGAPPARVTATLREVAPLTVADADTAANWPQAAWWRGYDDPVLTTLIERAIANAPRIAAADARIATAEQNVRVTSAALGLRVDASAQYAVQRLSDHGLLPTRFIGFNWYDQSDLGLNVRYQFDWWGKQRAAIEGALDQARASAAEQRAATLALSAAVAESYFGWQTDSARIGIAQQSIGLREQAAQLAQKRALAHLDRADTALQVVQSLAAHHEQLATLEGSRQLRLVTLAALLGVAGAELPALGTHPLPRPAATLPADAGTGLLARRPDIVASRWRVEAALQGTEEVRASYYPDISLHALAGLSSIDLGKLLHADASVPVLGAAINLPLFDSGLRKARHGAATARLAEAITAYDETVINAAREAGAAAAAIAQAQQQRALREQQRTTAQLLLGAAEARVRAGLTHQGPQLEAGLAVLLEQDALIQIDHSAVVADIQLKQSLGGGLAQPDASP